MYQRTSDIERPEPLLVARDQLLAAREARAAGQPAERRDRVVRVAGLRPGGDEVADVGERVADRGQLPVEDRDQPRRRAGGEHHVAEPVVAVHDRRRRRTRACARRATPTSVVEHRQLARLVVLPQPAEAPQLAVEVAGRLAVAVAARTPPSRRRGSRPARRRAPRRSRRRSSSVSSARRQRAGDDVAGDALHDVERRADHATRRRTPASTRGVRTAASATARQQPRLAQHVVRGGRQRRARRAAQHELGVAAADQVGDVRVARRRPARASSGPEPSPWASR